MSVVDPDPTYVQARLDASPAWFRDPVGSAFSVGFGQEEDAQVLLKTQSVQARYPLLAPLDSPGVSTALSNIGNDRQLLPTFDDNANLDGYRAWLMSGMTAASAAGYTLPWFPQTDYAAGTVIGNAGIGVSSTGSVVGGLVWTCSVAGTSGNAPPFPTTARVGQVVTETVATGVVAAQWIWQGALIAQGAPWTDATFFSQGATVYGGGLLWINVALGGGTTGGSFPFPSHPTRDLVVQDNTARWQLLSAPVDPAAPGYYSSGTIDGLTAAFTNSGFFDVGPGGIVIPVRYYTNNDWHHITSVLTGTGTGTCIITGYAGASVDLIVTVIADGTAGAADTGSISVSPASTPLWLADQPAAVGDFTHSTNGDVYLCTTGGLTGSTEPFPAGTPDPSTYPPSYGQGYTDGVTVQWVLATYLPIPNIIPIGSYGITLDGDFTATDTYEVTYSPVPPDGRNGAWARLWAVLPVGHFSGAAKLWGDGLSGMNRPLQFGGLWGRSPGNLTVGNHTPAVPWGLTGEVSANYLYGLIQSILARFVSGHVRFIGAWVVLGTDTAIDTIPAASPWREWQNITIDGTNPPFFRFNSESP